MPDCSNDAATACKANLGDLPAVDTPQVDPPLPPASVLAKPELSASIAAGETGMRLAKRALTCSSARRIVAVEPMIFTGPSDVFAVHLLLFHIGRSKNPEGQQSSAVHLVSQGRAADWLSKFQKAQRIFVSCDLSKFIHRANQKRWWISVDLFIDC